jgi:hypothetical protein
MGQNYRRIHGLLHASVLCCLGRCHRSTQPPRSRHLLSICDSCSDNTCAQILDNWAALNHESQGSTPSDSKCVVAAPVLIAFLCTQVSVPSDSWPPPRTAHFAASLLHSASVSFTCPQVLPIPFPFLTNTFHTAADPAAHMQRAFSTSVRTAICGAPPLHLFSRLFEVPIAFSAHPLTLLLYSVCVRCVRSGALHSKGETGLICRCAAQQIKPCRFKLSEASRHLRAIICNPMM